jgi:hypothetical protein
MAAGAPHDGFWFHKSLFLDKEEALEGITPLTRMRIRRGVVLGAVGKTRKVLTL